MKMLDEVEYILAECGGDPPEEPDWKRLFGSNVARADTDTIREKIRVQEAKRHLTWVLVALRVQAEIQNAEKPNGGVDISVLLSQTWVNSASHEAMRQYINTLVTS
ncbi:uncharacterized protein Z518_02669 [Rhinocladiella mackenziei CBS 650.93]|uniref:Uncharacterized protein n=1 Tax=Rhinocladiella mackenziei CBS 650.93 TaxID=1442369 RepID=A0A0D2IQ69_9EURO|nr:uncharacterized protein Z518_02669 [Rhinocladiella mackenziei CBS 650.93]KIX08014.1 hypothetical protein Z518_02669 [Rhinocladiella mackenziei CBS 650.93]